MTDHNLWDQAKTVAPQAASLGIVTAGAVIASGISYQHEYELARHNGQAAWVSGLLPFSVDGMIFVAGVALAWAAANGIKGSRRTCSRICGSGGSGLRSPRRRVWR